MCPDFLKILMSTMFSHRRETERLFVDVECFKSKYKHFHFVSSHLNCRLFFAPAMLRFTANPILPSRGFRVFLRLLVSQAAYMHFQN